MPHGLSLSPGAPPLSRPLPGRSDAYYRHATADADAPVQLPVGPLFTQPRRHGRQNAHGGRTPASVSGIRPRAAYALAYGDPPPPRSPGARASRSYPTPAQSSLVPARYTHPLL